LESVNLYSFYLFETEYSVVERLQNEYTSFLGLPIFRENNTTLFIVFIFSLYILIQTTSKNNMIILQDFSHLFFGIFFSLFFPAAFDFVFTTTSLLTNDINAKDFFLSNQNSV
jgi:hypothetical protein